MHVVTLFVTLAALIAQAPDGAVIEVPGGTYHENVTIDSRHGVRLHPRAGEHVVIDGAIEIRSSSDVEVRGFEVRNARGIGFTSWGSSNVTIAGNDVHDCARAGIWAGFDKPGASHGIVIRDNVVTNSVLENRDRAAERGWSQAIGVQYCDGVTIERNRVTRNYGEGINVCVTDHAKVLANELSDNFSFEVYLDNARYVTVDQNTISTTNDRAFFRYGQPASGIGCANEEYAYTTSLSHLTITNNIIRGARDGFYYGDFGRGGGMHDVRVTGNTFVGCRRRPVYIEKARHTGVVVKANAIR